MSSRRARLRRALTLSTTAALLAVDVALLHHLPTLRTVMAPFNIEGRAGTPTIGPAMQVTVEGVEISSTAIDSNYSSRTPISALGRWVAVHTVAAATSEPLFLHARLIVGSDSYLPSPQFGLPISGGQLVPGIRLTGSWVFDVATELVEPNAARPIQLQLYTLGVLSNQLVIDLADLTPARLDVIELPPASTRAQ